METPAHVLQAKLHRPPRDRGLIYLHDATGRPSFIRFRYYCVQHTGRLGIPPRTRRAIAPLDPGMNRAVVAGEEGKLTSKPSQVRTWAVKVVGGPEM